MELVFSIMYLLAGAAGGIILGFLGTGSTLVILPILVFIFPYIFPDEDALHFAVATTVAAMVVGACSSAVYCIKHRLYDKGLIIGLMLPLIAGSLLAPIISSLLPCRILGLYIAGCVFLIGLYNLFFKSRCNGELKSHSLLLSMLFAFFNSIVSGVSGIALGVLMIPYLTRYIPFQQAKGTTVIFSFFYGLFVTVGYVMAGWEYSSSDSLGFIYLPALIFASISMAVFPIVGCRLSNRVSVDKLQRFLYCFLIVTGVVIFAESF